METIIDKRTKILKSIIGFIYVNADGEELVSLRPAI
jgi:hypothetical protein